MGLTTWKNATKGPIRKPDVSVAKNYLDEKEMKGLDRIVSMYLDYAEDQAEKGVPMTMTDWSKKLNAFLQFNEKEVLEGTGNVTAAIAKAFAENEFEAFHPIQLQKIESDFDRDVKKITQRQNE